MASGTFPRPLPDPAEEKALLGLSGAETASYQLPAGTTRHLAFATEIKDGVLIVSAGLATKRGMYIFGSTSSGAISITPILTPTQSGMSITSSGNNIVITNGTSDLFVLVIQYRGALPAVVTP